MNDDGYTLVRIPGSDAIYRLPAGCPVTDENLRRFGERVSPPSGDVVSDPTDLVEWLPACYDRAEQQANAVSADPIAAVAAGLEAASADERRHNNTEAADALAWAARYVAETAPPLVLHDPKWRLADIARKRLILAEHEPEDLGVRKVCSVCADPPQYDASWREWPCRTVRLLAAEFDGEPGYDAQRWAP